MNRLNKLPTDKNVFYMYTQPLTPLYYVKILEQKPRLIFNY